MPPLGARHLASLDAAAFTLPASDAMRRLFSTALSIREELSRPLPVRTGPGVLVVAPRAVLVPLVTAALTLYAEEARLLQALASRVDEHPAVTAARRLVRHRLAEKIDLGAMADAAHVTPEHLVVLFRKHLSTTPMRYVWSERVRLGIHLLQHTDLSVAEVASRAGFQTSNHFSRHVRAAEGAPPRAVRQRRAVGV